MPLKQLVILPLSIKSQLVIWISRRQLWGIDGLIYEA